MTNLQSLIEQAQRIKADSQEYMNREPQDQDHNFNSRMQKADEIGRWHALFENRIVPYITELERKASQRDELLRALSEATDWIDELFPSAEDKPEDLPKWQALIARIWEGG